MDRIAEILEKKGVNLFQTIQNVYLNKDITIA